MATYDLKHLAPLFAEFKLTPNSQAALDDLLHDCPPGRPLSNKESDIWLKYARHLEDFSYEEVKVSTVDIAKALVLIDKFIQRYGAVYTLFGIDRVGGSSSEIRSIIRTALYLLNPERYAAYETYATDPEFDGFYTNGFAKLATPLL